MEPRAPAEYILEVFADQTLVKDIVKGCALNSCIPQVLPLTKPLRCSPYHILPSLLSLHTTFSARPATPRYYITVYRRPARV